MIDFKNASFIKLKEVNVQEGQAMVGDLLIEDETIFNSFKGKIKHRKIKCRYFGIDLNPKLIQIGRTIYPAAKSEVRDFQEKEFKRKFD